MTTISLATGRKADSNVVQGVCLLACGYVMARVPTRNVARFDWVSRLRGLTGGRGAAIVKVDGYEPVPEAIAKKLLTRA